MTRKVILAVAIALAFGSGLATAQDNVLAELYGQGVHNYFASRYAEAHQSLSTAIEQGSADPRCYFFRGLSLLRMGRVEEAESDFEKGAQLEVTGRDRVYPVGRSLQRIQGRDRLTLERSRRSARIAARIEAMKVQRARFEEMKRAEEQVVRDPDRKPSANPQQLLGDVPADDPSDPFAGEEVAPQAAPPRPTVVETTPKPSAPGDESPAATTTPPPSAGADDPFVTPPATPPAADDPFGTPPSAPASDDPFGTPPADTPPAADDPFGAPADPASSDEDPFGAPPSATDDDPFADDPFN